jgi:quercetin dioxygenase-like cupin family protein
VYDGREWLDARAGDHLFVLAGGVHGFRNESGARASMLLLFAPGAPGISVRRTSRPDGTSGSDRTPSPFLA